MNEIAVLYRAHHQALELQIELTRRGIPYEIRSGLRFFEQQHVKDVLAYLRLLVNPKEETSFKRLLKLLPKVGERTAATLWTAVADLPDPVAAFCRTDFRKAPAGAQGGLKRLAETLAALRRPSLLSSPAEAIRHVVDEGGYADVAKSKFENHQSRLDDLEALAQFALPYDGVESFLQEITLFGEPSGETTIAGEKEDERLVLSSVHQAKGLEWRAVFVIGLIEDRFPNVRAARTAEGLEEERRLFYVAATRAKDELFLVHPLAAFDRYGIIVVTEPSRFLRELPEGLLERWVLEPGPPLPPGLPGASPRLAEAGDPTLEDDPEDVVN